MLFSPSLADSLAIIINLKHLADGGTFKYKYFNSFTFSVVVFKFLLPADTVTFSGMPAIVIFSVEFLKWFDRFAKMLSCTIF